MVRAAQRGSERAHRKRPVTFADVRRDAEKRMARGLKLDFDQIMLEIAVICERAGKPLKN